MSHRTTSPDQVRDIVRKAVQDGTYEPGETLPSTRDLAQQFGINRNTAGKIYRELVREGLLDSQPNQPPRVRQSALRQPVATVAQRLRSSLWPLLQEGQLRGLSEADIRLSVDQVLKEFFATYTPPSIYFVECNREDSERYARELTATWDSPVQPVLLDQLAQRDPADAVITPLFHLAEVRDELGDYHDRAIGIPVSPVVDDVTDVVSRIIDGPVGLVAGNPAAVERLSNVIEFYVQVPVLSATVDDHKAIADLIERSDVVACTSRCRSTVDQLGGSEKAVTVRYYVDPATAEVLRRRVATERSKSVGAS